MTGYDSLYADGRRYDLMFAAEHPPDSAEVRFWQEQARRCGDPVLELACGTGRLALPLARDGRQVTGIDLSAGMLREARCKAEAAGLPLECLAGDMRAFDLGRRFSFVYLANNTVCHLLTRAEFGACMACVRRHLTPRGRFLLDVFVPDPALLLPRPRRHEPFAQYEDPEDGSRVEVTETYVYEADTQIKRITLHYVWPDGREQRVPLDMRMFFPQELDALLEHCGLAIDRKMGANDGSAFIASSTRQLVLCRLAS